MKEKVKALWKSCFDDSEAFVDLYFRLRYSEDINVAIKSEGKVISALQMIPYPMTFCGETIRTAYISGACTHPDFRGKGVMRQLLSQSFHVMLDRSTLFSTLIPANSGLFNYYERMGYATTFQYAAVELAVPKPISTNDSIVTEEGEYQEEVYAYLNSKLTDRACCIQHTPEDFNVILQDLRLSKGRLVVARQNQAIVGMALCYQEEKHVTINELFAEDYQTEQALIARIYQLTECNKLTRLLPSTDRFPKQSLGMARIIDAKKALQLYASAFPEKEMQLKLSDELLPDNNGYYYLSKGKCVFSITRIFERSSSLTISELTHQLLNPLHPYMSLMLN